MRAYVHDNAVYVIRDVRSIDGKMVTCQYATRDYRDDTVWRDCPEGVLFKEIRPLVSL